LTETPHRACEELLELYLDGELGEDELHGAEEHLDECGYCRRNYRFERLFRAYMRQAVSEPMSPELSSKLAALRSSAV
jgi:predicted anti-sigma-YlaC factor YlaD